MVPEGRKVGSLKNVEKLRAAVARSTFQSQNVQNTRATDPFSTSNRFPKLGFPPHQKRPTACSWCQHSTLHPALQHPNRRGSNLDFFIGVKVTQFSVRVVDRLHPELFAVQMSKNDTPLWPPSPFTSQNVQNTRVLEHFSRFRCRNGARQKK